MLAFLNGNRIDLKEKKIIKDQSNLSIAKTAAIGETFYFSVTQITDAPKEINGNASFDVITYETEVNGVDFMYQLLFWDSNNGLAWFRGTYDGRNGLEKSNWHNLV